MASLLNKVKSLMAPSPNAKRVMAGAQNKGVFHQHQEIVRHISKLKVAPTKLLYRPKPKSKAAATPPFLLVEGTTDSGESALYLLISTEASEPEKQLAYAQKAYYQATQDHYLFQAYMTEALPSIIEAVLAALSNHRSRSHHDKAVDPHQWLSHFNGILEKAIALNSSDIHIIANHGKSALVQARVHSDLETIDQYTYVDMLRLISSVYNQIASGTSKDQSYDPRLVHETAIAREVNGEPYQLRFISVPCYPQGSFCVVMRLLPLTASDHVMSLAQLGYSPSQMRSLEKGLQQSSGLVVLSGEVGSGKSTTNQTLLTQLIQQHRGKKKAYTVEFPVEYVIEGAVQLELKRDRYESVELADKRLINTLDDLLRMDPNFLLLGEVRGKSVAQLAKQMVQSGHKVLTTVHAQNALKIFSRFLGLGIDREVLTEPGFFSALVYQSLLKTPCQHCAKTLDQFNDTSLNQRFSLILARYCLDSAYLSNVRIVNEAGCEHCLHGIAGRTVVAEVLTPNLAILEALKIGDYAAAYEAWRQSGEMTFKEHALYKIFKGEICPVDFEQSVQMLDEESIYADIDQAFYGKVLSKELSAC